MPHLINTNFRQIIIIIIINTLLCQILLKALKVIFSLFHYCSLHYNNISHMMMRKREKSQRGIQKNKNNNVNKNSPTIEKLPVKETHALDILVEQCEIGKKTLVCSVSASIFLYTESTEKKSTFLTPIENFILSRIKLRK